jgi:hypothetical protein
MNSSLLTSALAAQNETYMLRLRTYDTLLSKAAANEVVARTARFGTQFEIEYRGRVWNAFTSTDLPKGSISRSVRHDGEMGQIELLFPVRNRRPADLLLLLKRNRIDINYRGDGPLIARNLKRNVKSYVAKETAISSI